TDAVKAVRLRGKYMQEAAPEGAGKMFAILRVPQETIEKACEAASNEQEKVMPANYNEPGQTVISGHAQACERAVAWLKKNYEGKQMAVPLKVSAPFHSSLMLPAQEKLASHLSGLNIGSNKVAYIANIDAQEYKPGAAAETIRENLVKQVSGSVLWNHSLQNLPGDTAFIEVGPGKVLTGLNKKINKDFKTYTLDSEQGFEGLKEFLS
ncbi:MAG: ACP S-malonyltransferase, partial [Bacteriovoracaceae bacterium]